MAHLLHGTVFAAGDDDLIGGLSLRLFGRSRVDTSTLVRNRCERQTKPVINTIV
jgi:hypothetical protein